MKTFLINLLTTALLMMAFDVATFLFLPLEYTFRFEEYRRTLRPSVGGREAYPENYFVSHRLRGFDIGKNKAASHWVDGITYPVWSNSLGCFDVEHAAYDRYVYFAGDSYVWGYAPFDQKFGTVIERTTGTQILKCGVTHTGQRHQYDKFSEIVDKVGSLPKALFVFFAFNDVANDNAYPHSTVIDGWMVDTVSIDENDALVRREKRDLKVKIENKVSELQRQDVETHGLWDGVARALKTYSLSVNILVLFTDYVAGMLDPEVPAGKKGSTSEAGPSLRNFHAILQERNGRYWYSDHPKAQKSKAALLAFSRFSTERDIAFVVVLIPPKGKKAMDPTWYDEVHGFLSANSIQHIDLATEFQKRRLEPNDLYWKHDGHFNPAGNTAIAEILVDAFPDIFRE